MWRSWIFSPGDFFGRWISNNLGRGFCQDALDIALGVARKQETPHSDQSFQLTSGDFVSSQLVNEIKISWLGRKRCYDNLLVERLRRTVKFVAAGLSAKPSRGLPACLQQWLGGGNQLGRSLCRYGHVRQHSSLGLGIPHVVYNDCEYCSSCTRFTISEARTVQ